MQHGNVPPTDMEFRPLWPRSQVGMASRTGELQRAGGAGTRFQGPWALPSADSSDAGLWTGAGVPGKGLGRGVFANHYTRTSTFLPTSTVGHYPNTDPWSRIFKKSPTGTIIVVPTSQLCSLENEQPLSVWCEYECLVFSLIFCIE